MCFPSQLVSPHTLRSAVPPLLVVWVGCTYGVVTSESLSDLARPAGFAMAAIMFWSIASLVRRPQLQYVAIPLTFVCSHPQHRTWTYRPWESQLAGFEDHIQCSFVESLWWYVVAGTIAYGLLLAPGAMRRLYRFACPSIRHDPVRVEFEETENTLRQKATQNTPTLL